MTQLGIGQWNRSVENCFFSLSSSFFSLSLFFPLSSLLSMLNSCDYLIDRISVTTSKQSLSYSLSTVIFIFIGNIQFLPLSLALSHGFNFLLSSISWRWSNKRNNSTRFIPATTRWNKRSGHLCWLDQRRICQIPAQFLHSRVFWPTKHSIDFIKS